MKTSRQFLQTRRSGQVLLIVLLVLTVATTVALSLVSRSTVDQNISAQVEESTRAFNAAEAGIEEALQTKGSIAQKTIDAATNAQVAVTRSDLGGGASYTFPKRTLLGSTETVWLVNRNETTNVLTIAPTYTTDQMDICWDNDGATTVALLGTVFYSRAGVYYTAKFAYDAASGSRGNNMDLPSGSGCTTANGARIQFSLLRRNSATAIDPTSDSLVLIRLKPLYGSTQISIRNSIPKQGNTFESTGTTGSGVTRRILVHQQYRAPSSIFDYALYSQSTITK